MKYTKAKKITLLFICAILLMCVSRDAKAAPNEQDFFKNALAQEIQKLKTFELDTFFQNLPSATKDIAGSNSFTQIIHDTLSGQYSLEGEKLLNDVIGLFLNEFKLTFSLGLKILILALLCSMIKQMQNNFASESISDIAFFACYGVIVLLSAYHIMDIAQTALNAMNSVVQWMDILLPIQLVLLAGVGGLSSSAVFQPIGFLLLKVSGSVLRTLFIPVVSFLTMLTVVNHLSDKIKLTKLSSLVHSAVKWVMGIMVTVFSAATALKGLSAAVMDGVSLKTAKYAVSHGVPLVGGMMSDSIDALVGCSLLVKNGVGVAGLIVLIVICIIPIVKIITGVFLYKICAAVAQPITDDKLVGYFKEVSQLLTLIGGILIIMAMMFFIFISLVMAAANLTIMVR